MMNRILYVEDNFADVTLFKEFMPDHYELTVVSDGRSAKKYLGELHLNTSMMPRLIILDINLPDLSGLELLKIVKSDIRLKHIPTIMFSSSDNNVDVKDAYSNAANGYVTKAMNLDQYRDKMNSFLEYWFETAELPNQYQ